MASYLDSLRLEGCLCMETLRLCKTVESITNSQGLLQVPGGPPPPPDGFLDIHPCLLQGASRGEGNSEEVSGRAGEVDGAVVPGFGRHHTPVCFIIMRPKGGGPALDVSDSCYWRGIRVLISPSWNRRLY